MKNFKEFIYEINKLSKELANKGFVLEVETSPMLVNQGCYKLTSSEHGYYPLHLVNRESEDTSYYSYVVGYIKEFVDYLCDDSETIKCCMLSDENKECEGSQCYTFTFCKQQVFESEFFSRHSGYKKFNYCYSRRK